MPKGLQVYKVNVRYKDDEHEPQVIAVSRNQDIRSARDAEAHCLRVLQHYNRQTDESYPCVSAVAVRDEAFDIEDAPMTSGAAEALKAQTVVTP